MISWASLQRLLLLRKALVVAICVACSLHYQKLTVSAAFTTVTSSSSSSHQIQQRRPCFLVQRIPPPLSVQLHGKPQILSQFSVALVLLQAKKNYDNDNDDDDNNTELNQVGMENAFRQLEFLDSLSDDENENENENDPNKRRQSSRLKMDDDAKAATAAAAVAASNETSMEKEAQLFTSMLNDSTVEAYRDVMTDLGGTPKEVPSISTSNTNTNNNNNNNKNKKEPQISIIQQEKGGNRIPKSEEDTEQFLNQAIQEALDEASNMIMSSKSTKNGQQKQKQMSDSILDDEEIMKEIEEIFDKGNEKLLASLEDIRKEQVQL